MHQIFTSFNEAIGNISKTSFSFHDSMIAGMKQAGLGDRLPVDHDEWIEAWNANNPGVVSVDCPDFGSYSTTSGFTFRLWAIEETNKWWASIEHPTGWHVASTLALSCLQNGWQWSAGEKPEGFDLYDLERATKLARALEGFGDCSYVDHRHLMNKTHTEELEFAIAFLQKQLDRNKRIFHNEPDNTDGDILLGIAPNWRDFVNFDDDDDE